MSFCSFGSGLLFWPPCISYLHGSCTAINI